MRKLEAKDRAEKPLVPGLKSIQACIDFIRKQIPGVSRKGFHAAIIATALAGCGEQETIIYHHHYHGKPDAGASASPNPPDNSNPDTNNTPNNPNIPDAGNSSELDSGNASPSNPQADAGANSPDPDVEEPNDALGLCEDQHPVVEAFFKLEPDLAACANACHKANGLGDGAWYWSTNLGNVQDSFDSVVSQVMAPNGQMPDGTPKLSFIPTQVQNNTHPGGVQELSPAAIQEIAEFANLLDQNSAGINNGNIDVDLSCGNAVANLEAQYFQGVETLPAQQTYIRFLRNITGAPLPAALPNIINDGQLRLALEQATQHVGFYDWLRDNFNDITLTRFYRNEQGSNDPDNTALALMANQYGINWNTFDNDEVADGPQNHLAWIVKNNQPVSKLFTDPAVVVPGQKPANLSYDPNWPNRLQLVPVGQTTPAAGIASDRLWLERVPFTPTNLSRNRAYLIMRDFYDLDVFDIASQAMIGEPPQEAFPELTVEECAQCHQDTPLDSIAAAFYSWQNGTYNVEANLPAKLLNPTFNGQQMPGFLANQRLKWVMEQLVSDPQLNPNDPNYDPDKEFPHARSWVKHTFKWMMGREVAGKPKAGEANYDEKLKAYTAENQYVREMAAWFKNNGYNLRKLVVEMALSPYFRVSGKLTAAINDSRAAEIANLNPPFATAETMEKRFRQLFGKSWEVLKKGKGNKPDKITNLFALHRVDLGGIDSKAVQERKSDPSAQSELVMDFMAHDIGRLVALELSAAPQNRHLLKELPFNNFLEVPENPITGVSDPVVELRYRKQIARILRLALGEYHAPNSPIIDAELAKWKLYWQTGLNSPSFSTELATQHQVKGTAVINDTVVNDPQLVRRTWIVFIGDVLLRTKFRI